VEGKPLLPKGGKGNLISKLTSYEVGYNGRFGDRFTAGVNVYYLRNSAGAGFQQINPVVSIASLGPELGNAVQDKSVPQLIAGLQGLGLDQATATVLAGAIGPMLNEAYQQAGDVF